MIPVLTMPPATAKTTGSPLAGYALDPYGFLKQIDPKPFPYTEEYDARQSTNPQMSWLRLGWLAAHIPFETLQTFQVVDIGAGNRTFIKQASKVFKRVVPYDLVGESIPRPELMATAWDLVVLSDVLEHYQEINEFWDLSFKFALISYPETPPPPTDLTRWRHYKPDEHIYCLNREAFAAWAKGHGCQVVAMGCPEDMIRMRQYPHLPNITTALIRNPKF